MKYRRMSAFFAALFFSLTLSAPFFATEAVAAQSAPADSVKDVEFFQLQFEKAKYQAFKIYCSAMEQYKEGKITSGTLGSIARLYELSLQFAAISERSGVISATLAKVSQASPAFMSMMPNTLEVLSTPFVSEASRLTSQTIAQMISGKGSQAYPVNAEHLREVGKFLKTNVSETGMPLSFQVPKGYWKKVQNTMDDVDSVLERLLTNYSLSIYDAAVWQIALTVLDGPGKNHLVDQYSQNLIKGSIGESLDIRATYPFLYGDKKVILPRENAYFFRIISDKYLQSDPKDGKNMLVGFPNSEILHQEDWKPITGEQAWAAIIGPLQTAYQKYGQRIPADCPELKLALSILPALEAMQSPIGAIYHAPDGTHGKNPKDISNENNFSVYAALKMLKSAARQRPAVVARIQKLLRGQENYFKEYAFNLNEEIFYQGGYYVDNHFIPTEIFAVDCQSWGTAVLGAEFIDKTFGDGAAYRIWQNTKKRSGFYDGGRIIGIGFTNGHKILSSEWTAGALLNLRLMAQSYKKSHPIWAAELEREAIHLRYGLEYLKADIGKGGVAYKYSNARTFIPFGWWANPIPSLVSSSWVILIDYGFNPFVLGGGPDFNPGTIDR